MQALLGPPPTDESASWAASMPTKAIKLQQPIPERAATLPVEKQRLWALRAKWATEPLAFVIWTRLAVNAAGQQLPDTCAAYLRRALAAAGRVGGYPLEAAELNRRLSNYHWARQEADSALKCHRREISLLENSGRRTDSRRAVALVIGDSLNVGIGLGGAYANAGLALRRRGDYSGAVQAYANGLRRYEAVRYLPGLIWVQELLGEAYEEQGNDAKAATYYAAAQGTGRAMRATERTMAAVDFAESVSYAHALLLRQDRAAALLRLLKEGIGEARAAWAADTAYWRLAGIGANLELRVAEVYLRNHHPAAAAAALRRAAPGLAVIARRAPTPPLRRHFNYYIWRAREQALHGWLARASGQPADPVRTRAALAYADSLDAPAERTALHLELADYLLQAADPAAAVALLRPVQARFQAARNRLKQRETYRLQAAAYRALGQWQAAFEAKEQAEQLTDALRSSQQYAALAEMETRYQTREKEARIGQLTDKGRQEARQKQGALVALLVLALLLMGGAWVLRRTRHLNRQLEAKGRQLAEQAEQLTALDRLKSDFFANVSHELRTPLTLITGPAEALLEQPPAALPDPARAQVALMLRNGERLQELVNSILDLSKLEVGRMRMQVAPVALGALFGRIGEGFASLADRRGLTLSWQVDVPADRTVVLDAGKLEQIVTNLVGNALKFTPSGGRIWVHLASAEGSSGGSGEIIPSSEYRLTVRDTGPGIAADEQERVFERFYQSRSQQAQGGTGIGLALSRELAALLGGTLVVASRVGEGSTFTLTFRAESVTIHPALAEGRDGSDEIPEKAAFLGSSDESEIEGESAVSAEDAAEANAYGATSSGEKLLNGRPRILVVEDHADLRQHLRDLLTPYYDVLEAENGRAALEILSHESVDLISSDAMMPEMGGIELLSYVKAQSRWARVPFLMLTARADDGHRLDALALGVDDYLSKPFRSRELLARVDALLGNYFERQRWLDTLTRPDAPTPAEELASTDQSETPTETALEESFETNTPEAAEPTTPPDAAVLRQWQALAEASTHDPAFTAAELAQQLGLSERSLYRRFKELTGQTPAAWLRELRLNHARRLLEVGTGTTVAEVAYAAGFNDPGYFGQLYYKRFGKRPSEYRLLNAA